LGSDFLSPFQQLMHGTTFLVTLAVSISERVELL
jgi:hypothetical protein